MCPLSAQSAISSRRMQFAGQDVPLVPDYEEGVTVTGGIEPVVLCESWSEINLWPQLRANITSAMYHTPRKIQAYTIPLNLEGFDVECHAGIGNGKTAAFLIPLINLINQEGGGRVCLHPMSSHCVSLSQPEIWSQVFDQTRKF